MATRLTIKDSGELKVFKHLRMDITGGIHEREGAAQHGKGPMSIVDVAAVNEFGNGRIPARMWLRGWVSKHQRRVVAQIRAAMVNMARTQKYQSGPFVEIQTGIKRSLKAQILSGLITPPNAPLTLAKKAPETRPLLKHGQLVTAIEGELRARNESGSINWNHKTR